MKSLPRKWSKTISNSAIIFSVLGGFYLIITITQIKNVSKKTIEYMRKRSIKSKIFHASSLCEKIDLHIRANDFQVSLSLIDDVKDSLYDIKHYSKKYKKKMELTDLEVEKIINSIKQNLNTINNSNKTSNQRLINDINKKISILHSAILNLKYELEYAEDDYEGI